MHEEGELPVTDIYLGRRLGGYDLVRRIGEGGMGAVYHARHTGSGEEAAIKVIKLGMDSEAILRRFHNERRIVASLDHPNIAKLLDAGATAEGLPYFVMEYIPGLPINKYCDTNRLTIEERLRLFLKVCSAVDRAHQIHVVHRDIKPENILVLESGDGAPGEPKLLDFGIAKILNPSLVTSSQEITVTLGPLMTPHYASPEQARSGTITPASDIYSLGVLLYELLTGHSPYRSAVKSAPALVDAICRERPRTPSSSISRTETADPELPEICANRRTTPSGMRESLSGNLDAVLLTALEKEPANRYTSVAEFAGDLSRHLEGQTVSAREFKRRYAHVPKRTRWIAGAAFVLMFVLVCAGIFYQRRLRAGISVRPSVAVLGFENLSHQSSAEWLSTALTEMLSTELSAGDRLRTVPGELVSRVKLELALPNAQTLTKPTLQRLRRSLSSDYVVLGSYLALGEGRDLQVRLDLRLQDADSGDVVATVSETRSSGELPALVSRAGTLLRRKLGAGEVSAADSAPLRGSLPEGAEAARNYSEGLERLRTFDTLAARDLLRNAVAAAPNHALSHAALAAASSLLGYDMEARDEAKKALDLSTGLSREARLSIEGRFFETTRSWDKAIAAFQTLRREYPDNLEYGLRLAAAQSQAGQSRSALETVKSLRELPSAVNDPRVELAEAEAALAASDLSRALAAAGRAAQSGAEQGFRILAAQAHLLESRIAIQSGDPQRALTAAAQSQQLYLAAGHRQGVAMALNESAGVLNQRGDVAGARARYEEALVVCRTIGDQTCVGTDLDSLGVLRRRQGDLRGSVEMHQQALEIRRSVGDQAGVATSLYNLANVWEILGDLPRAQKAGAESLDLRNQLAERRSAALTMSRLGNIRRRLGNLDDAIHMTGQAVTTLRSIGDRGGTAMAQANHGLSLFDQGEVARARAEFEAALAVRRQQHDKNNISLVLASLASVALAEDKIAEATTLITESITLRQELGETISLAQSKLVLAEIQVEQGRYEAAGKTAREAAASFHAVLASGWEAEASLVLGRSALALGDVGQARASLDSASRLLNDSKDLPRVIRRGILQARLHFAAGQHAESAAILERLSEQAGRAGLKRAQMEIRLALVQTGRATAASLVADARKAGFHLIERKAGDPAPASPPPSGGDLR